MKRTPQSLNLIIHDGREDPIDLERMIRFDQASAIERYFGDREVDTSKIFEMFGPWVIDFTNLHAWSKDIPDIDPRSARLFSIWLEDADSKEIIGAASGFFLLVPFTFSTTHVRDYYSVQDAVPYYPMAIMHTMRTVIKEETLLDQFLDRLREGISENWKKRREEVIRNLPKQSELWERYVFSFENIIHFTFLFPSIDRELIDSLLRNNYRISGVMQLLASPTPSYTQLTIKQHLRAAQKILDEARARNESISGKARG
ncbi:MAG: hypothetical protein ACFFE8_01770 [Candidatus Heimdallarchaeota archaeon]